MVPYGSAVDRPNLVILVDPFIMYAHPLESSSTSPWKWNRYIPAVGAVNFPVPMLMDPLVVSSWQPSYVMGVVEDGWNLN